MIRVAILMATALTVAGCHKPSPSPSPSPSPRHLAPLPEALGYYSGSPMGGQGESWHVDRSGQATFAHPEEHMMVTRQFDIRAEGFRQVSDKLGSPIPDMQCAFIAPDSGGGRVTWTKGGVDKTYDFFDGCPSHSPEIDHNPGDALDRINAATVLLRCWFVCGLVIKREKIDWPPR